MHDHPNAPSTAHQAAPQASASALAVVDHGPCLGRWKLLKNCALTPKQVAAAYAVLALASLIVGAGFASVGASYVLGFAGLEVLAAGVAFLVWARHAVDGETVSLYERVLRIEKHNGDAVTTTELPSAWTRVVVEPRAVQLAVGNRRVRVGVHAHLGRRKAFARELAQRLSQTQAFAQA
jgi:uncharacterized membrane protein